MFYLQYLVPHHLITNVYSFFATSKSWLIKNLFCRTFTRLYNIDLKQAELSTLSQYESFNHLFTRALKKEARPIDSVDLISPCDGILQVKGEPQDKGIVVKKRLFKLEELITQEYANSFSQPEVAVIYLAPHHYHRVHAPCDFVIQFIHHIPGKLFSVAPSITSKIPDVFSQNERVIFHGKTKQGPLSLVMVGAMLVGTIEPFNIGISSKDFTHKAQSFKLEQPHFIPKGEELGRFALGSSVVMVLEKGYLRDVGPNAELQMGQSLSKCQTLKTESV